jgi:hypothetical protein
MVKHRKTRKRKSRKKRGGLRCRSFNNDCNSCINNNNPQCKFNSFTKECARSRWYRTARRGWSRTCDPGQHHPSPETKRSGSNVWINRVPQERKVEELQAEIVPTPPPRWASRSNFETKRPTPPPRRATAVSGSNVETKVSLNEKGKETLKKCAKFSEKECPICFESMDDANNVKCCNCGHSFHKNCLDEWLMTKKTCPFCREPCGDGLVLGEIGETLSDLAARKERLKAAEIEKARIVKERLKAAEIEKARIVKEKIRKENEKRRNQLIKKNGIVNNNSAFKDEPCFTKCEHKGWCESGVRGACDWENYCYPSNKSGDAKIDDVDKQYCNKPPNSGGKRKSRKRKSRKRKSRKRKSRKRKSRRKR